MNYCELFFIQVFFLSGQSTPKKRLTAKRLVGCHRVSSGVFYKLAFTFEARHLSDFKYKKMYRREKTIFQQPHNSEILFNNLAKLFIQTSVNIAKLISKMFGFDQYQSGELTRQSVLDCCLIETFERMRKIKPKS